MEKLDMNNITVTENRKLIGLTLVAAVFNFDPYFLMDDTIKQNKRKERKVVKEDKQKQN